MMITEEITEKNMHRDSILFQFIMLKEGVNVSTPVNNKELQLIDSPVYINYQSLALSLSPSLPFFMGHFF